MNTAERRRAELNAGHMETSNLAEILKIDFAALLRATLPAHAERLGAELDALSQLGISARMSAVGHMLQHRLTPEETDLLGRHGSDTVRGWACFMIGARTMTLEARLDAIRPFADDTHFGVREWAWLAIRPAISAQLDDALEILTGWTSSPSERIRRFASEATRPRGVWCKHLTALKADPEPGRRLLTPLRMDGSVYVQDSVANWLNDAAKSRPDWVRALIAQWLDDDPPPQTRRIARRALRSL